jgi:osmotically-inducible protein OsmY
VAIFRHRNWKSHRDIAQEIGENLASGSIRQKSRSMILARRVRDRLENSGYLAIRQVECEVHDGVVFLDGRLRAQHMKQMALADALDVAEISRVENRIEVSPVAMIAEYRGFGQVSGRGSR